jgi:ABC-type uncharacterized transport system involved in gliding motility auxiliary subunit
MEGIEMLKKYEKLCYIVSPLLVLVSLFNYYIGEEFSLLSIVTLVAGLLIGLLFFVRFYDDIVQKITRRKIKYGINSILITVVVLAIIVIVYLVTLDRNKRFDLTQIKRFTLSDQTVKVLEGLEGPVHAYAFYSKQMDPTGGGIEEYGELLLEYGGKTEKVKTSNEEGVTNALIKLIQTELKTVYFVTGHGERSIQEYGNEGYDRIRAAIETENYLIEEILLLREERIPEEAAVVAAAGPRNDYEPYEIGLIDDYLQNGGRVLMLIDPEEEKGRHTNIAALLEKYGLILGNDVIIDPLSRVLSGDYFMPVINSYTYNPITKDFKIATFLRMVRSVSAKDDPGENIFVREVARTGEASWAETNFSDLVTGKAKYNEGVDREGPVNIMAYASISRSADGGGADESGADEEELPEDEKRVDAILAVIGDSDFVTNAMFQTQGNKDLFLNTINYLADRGELISVRPKQQESVFLTMTAQQGRIAFFVSIILIPLFVIAVGIYITIQRRVRS